MAIEANKGSYPPPTAKPLLQQPGDWVGEGEEGHLPFTASLRVEVQACGDIADPPCP